MKKTLLRQLKKSGLREDTLPESLEDWKSFLEKVNDTYTQYEEGRYLLERSLEISSKEMNEEIEKNKKMSLQLVHAARLSSLGTLASGIAHELNNPLAGLQGHIQVLNRQYKEGDKIKERFGKCLRLIGRMTGIVNHLRRLSRSESGGADETVDVIGSINDSFELLGKQLEVDDIAYEIVNNYGVEKIEVSGNENRMESVFQNLITNSFHAFQNNESIDCKCIIIEVNVEDETCLITYRDNAGGMEDEIARQIFDPFFTTKEVGSGTGLGMSICQRIVTECRGRLEFENKKGEGVIFRIYLPLVSEETKTVVTSLLEANVSPVEFLVTNFSEKKVLIVDDEEDICMVLKEVLSEKYIVEAFTDPVAALKELESEHYDVLLTDMKMPKKDGLTLAKEALVLREDLSVIFMSGHLEAEVLNAIEGFDHSCFLTKPFDDLLNIGEIIKEALSKKLFSLKKAS